MPLCNSSQSEWDLLFEELAPLWDVEDDFKRASVLVQHAFKAAVECAILVDATRVGNQEDLLGGDDGPPVREKHVLFLKEENGFIMINE